MNPLVPPAAGDAFRAGDLLHVTRDASVQFIHPIVFRVIRVRHEWQTYHGWLWLDGYQVDDRGEAVLRRTIFVRPAGLRRLTPAPSVTPKQRRNRGPVVSGVDRRTNGPKYPV
ncbi:hypothetical protein [Micromonospora sp. SH-82]|uniref:hypothetical protein n=1 Tax=Micromonospora sp. SH-82 TaxID=3132938 RepID=UPI003EBC7635